MQPAARALAHAALGALLLAGCHTKKLGDACAAAEVACQDPQTGLFCVRGHLATMSCMGKAGCQAVGAGDVACDNPVASAGDGCNQVKDAACTKDRGAALVCTGEKFVVAQPCKGPRGCMISGETVYCDNALAEPGDLCTEEGDDACRADRAAFMKCHGGKFQITSLCRGPRRCTVVEKPEENKEHFECDDSVTAPGDPCEEEGEASCGVDGRSVDTCKAHVIALREACAAGSACGQGAGKSRFECVAPGKRR